MSNDPFGNVLHAVGQPSGTFAGLPVAHEQQHGAGERRHSRAVPTERLDRREWFQYLSAAHAEVDADRQEYARKPTPL